MKRLITLVTLLVTSLSVPAQAPGSLAIGAAIPLSDVKMKSVDGKEFSIKDVVKKNGVLVMFSCNTCPYVVKYQQRTLDVVKDAAKKNIGVIIINSNEEYRNNEDSYDAMKAYAKVQGYTVPYVVDTQSKLADAFGATRTPECFLFDATGKLVYHGAIDDNQDKTQIGRRHLSVAMNEVIDGKEVSTKETRSIGCMIKRLE